MTQLSYGAMRDGLAQRPWHGHFIVVHSLKKGMRPMIHRRLGCTTLSLLTALSLCPASEIPQEGLLGYWSMDRCVEGQLPEGSGHELPARIEGEPEIVAGAEGGCLRLDGRRDYAIVPDSKTLDFSQATFSISAWVNIYAQRGEQQMIIAKNVYSANQREWGLMVDRDGRFRFYLQHARRWNTIESATQPTPGRWFHVAVTLDSGEAALFVNGSCEARSTLGRPIPQTEAPLTIGAVNDGGRIWQTLFGALDEIRLYDRALTDAEVAGMYSPVSATHPIPEDTRFPLWNPQTPVPATKDCPLLKNVRFSVIQSREPETDGYNWLHGAAICWHKDRLYASFGHNRGRENTATEVVNGRISRDGGRTWGPLFSIDGGDSSNPAVSHGVFLSHAGRLWAFHGSFQDRMRGVHTVAYVLDETNDLWQPQGPAARDGFWPCQAPVPMQDGNWIMAGISVDGGYGGTDDPAAVAISDGDDLSHWDVVKIPKPASLEIWGESAIIVDGSEVVLVSRWRRPIALASTSGDYGRTWTEIRESNLPMAASKPYTGILSNGQRYLICTTTADCGNRRSPLTIAVSRPGERLFTRIFRIRDAIQEGPGESHADCRLSYPYAVEYQGSLYVVYSNDGARGANRNSAELAVIPLESLAIQD